jgi:aspartate/methionine/tyrosine aminotransferase
MKVSKLADNIIGSEIIKLAAEVNQKIKQGEKIYNLTIGDFDPHEFPIPQQLKKFIIEEYNNDQTNYPSAEGMPELRAAISQLLAAERTRRIELLAGRDPRGRRSASDHLQHIQNTCRRGRHCDLRHSFVE